MSGRNLARSPDPFTFARMDKTFLLEQLGDQLRESLAFVHKATTEAKQDAKTGAPRAVNMAKGTAMRELEAKAALDALETFRPRALKNTDPIGLGAIVEVEDGEAGKTLFLAPVGAGCELTGPGGDGYFQVVTPVSPFGKALMGKRVGDVIEVTVKGELTEWEVTFVA
ncbi:MAG: GreA/GreB family elongation factor [Myxococcaceae bacterium]